MHVVKGGQVGCGPITSTILTHLSTEAATGHGAAPASDSSKQKDKDVGIIIEGADDDTAESEDQSSIVRS
ncbi:hypothetical protein ANCCAN_23628 [Ancylostoma caninum]|uniref:Uncharacterized protein n=1 Tax=Ancylostoma caninum TaxID=29170 RepID=A0A368FEW4_ANCCA|nr:hypothetical protein ANCCAN_23628 [Ancylostoma caninum]